MPMPPPKRRYPSDLFNALSSLEDIDRTAAVFEDTLFDNPDDTDLILDDLVSHERPEVVRLVLSWIDEAFILNRFPATAEAFDGSLAQKILSQLSVYFQFTPTGVIDRSDEERPVDERADKRREYFRQLVKDAPDALAALVARTLQADLELAATTKMSQKQMKQARRAAAKAKAPLNPGPFERLHISVPETPEEAEAAVKDILVNQEAILQAYLEALHSPELETSVRHACLPGEGILPPKTQSQVIEMEASPTASQNATATDSDALYPAGQLMKFTSLYCNSAKGFGEWTINISPRGERDLRDHSRRDRKIFGIILKKIKELSNGHFSPDNQKRLNGAHVDIPIYEAKMTGDLRLVYQIDCVPAYDSSSERQAIKIFGVYTHAQIGRVSFWDSMGRELGKKGKEYKDRCAFRKRPHHLGDHVFLPSIFPAPMEMRGLLPGKAPDLPPDDLEQIQSLLLKSVHFSQPLLEAIIFDLDVSFVLQVSSDELLEDTGNTGYIDDIARVEVSDTLEENVEKLEQHMEENACPTATRIGLRFDLPKFQLLHFVSPRRHADHYRPLPASFAGITVPASETAKLLGVVLDFKLTFRNHVELAQSRGMKAMLALSRISTPTLGLPHSFIRQLFQTVVVPRMEYGLPVWYRPVSSNSDARRSGSVWVAKALGKVQRLACKVITGGLRTTATDVLDFHANILPVHIRLNRTIYNAIVRLATLPPSHPLHRVFVRCRRVPRFHRSPIHHALAEFPSLRRNFEMIDPQLIIPPPPPGSITVSIAPSKEAATAEQESVTRQGGCCIYTDGSGFEGGVGAAAVAWNMEKEGVFRTLFLGEEEEHTVFESEVVGAILALDIIKSTPRLTSVDIFTDCQPAIQALSAPRAQPGQYLLAAFHLLHRRLLRARPTLKIRIHWVPAHIGIPGNEAVDARAKEAAQGASSALTSPLPLFGSPLPASKAAAIQAGAKGFHARWLHEWRTSPRYQRLTLFDNPNPSNAVSRMYEDLSRPQCSVLTQLRTAHIGLNSFLYRFHLGPSPDCPLCLVPETVSHYLLICPRFRRQRLQLIMKLGTARLSLRLLLAAKSDHKPVLAFVRDTERLPRYAL